MSEICTETKNSFFCSFQWHICLRGLLNAKSIIIDPRKYYLTCRLWNKGVHSFPKGVNSKLNGNERLELKLPFYDVVVQHCDHFDTTNPTTKMGMTQKYFKKQASAQNSLTFILSNQSTITLKNIAYYAPHFLFIFIISHCNILTSDSAELSNKKCICVNNRCIRSKISGDNLECERIELCAAATLIEAGGRQTII